MQLIKTSFLGFLATAIKIASNLILSKYIAVEIGTSGLSLIGQLQNFLQAALTASQAGITTGVTKYTAEFSANQSKLKKILSTALMITLLSSITVGIVTSVSSTYLSKILLNDTGYAYVFRLFGFTVTMFAINNLFLAIINGFKMINVWVKINIIQSCIMLTISLVLLSTMGIDGVFISLATNQSFVFIFVLIFVLPKQEKFTFEKLNQNFCKKTARNLLGFSLMTLSSAISVPLSLIIIRTHIDNTLGDHAAGLWQALIYISTSYLSLITVSLSTYFLPRLSEIKGKKLILKEINKVYKLALFILTITTLVIFLSRDLIIYILLSPDFSSLRELILYQLLGDFVKISAFIIGYISLAKAMHKIYIIKQIIVLLAYVIASYFLVNVYGLVGAIYGYIIAYTIGNVIGLVVLFFYAEDIPPATN